MASTHQKQPLAKYAFSIFITLDFCNTSVLMVDFWFELFLTLWQQIKLKEKKGMTRNSFLTALFKLLTHTFSTVILRLNNLKRVNWLNYKSD